MLASRDGLGDNGKGSYCSPSRDRDIPCGCALRRLYLRHRQHSLLKTNTPRESPRRLDERLSRDPSMRAGLKLHFANQTLSLRTMNISPKRDVFFCSATRTE